MSKEELSYPLMIWIIVVVWKPRAQVGENGGAARHNGIYHSCNISDRNFIL